MKQKITFFLLLVLTLFSCKSNKYFVEVENIKEVNEYKQNPLLYVLPQTVITFDVEITKSVYKKGPFAEYAEEFLGIKDVAKEDATVWSISDIDIQSYAKVDTNQIYVINSNFENISNQLNLSKEGFLLSINKPVGTYSSDIEFGDNMIIDNDIDINLSYGEVMVKNNLKEVYDTTYNETAADTSFIDIPIIKTQLVKKTESEQAQELAEQILTLRDDKNAILVGEGDSQYLPDGISLQTMLNGLAVLEEEYLSMFIGKTFVIKKTYHFEYTPDTKRKYKQDIIFRFSEDEGLFSADNIKGKPVYLQILSDNYTSLIDNFVESQNLIKRIEKVNEKNLGLVYRFPEKTKLKLIYKDKELFTKDLLIAQYGSNLRLPANLFLTNEYSIEFYPKYGTIKSIEKIIDTNNK